LAVTYTYGLAPEKLKAPSLSSRPAGPPTHVWALLLEGRARGVAQALQTPSRPRSIKTEMGNKPGGT